MARRSASAQREVPFLSKQLIENEAALLLAEYGNSHGPVTGPPVPVDEIVELYLELALEFKDMQQIFGFGDVHGALWVNDRRIGIDQSLDPARNQAMLGRYHFTLAHEAGHWRLHRRLYQRRADQPMLLEGAMQADYVCRSSDTSPIEWQANFFAASLMMPREMVKRSWHEWRGSMDPIFLHDLQEKRRQIPTAEALPRGGVKSGNDAIGDTVLEHCSRPLADKFQVSPEAMWFRLEELGLLLGKKEASLFD
jgi:IrrE N-terminal-like domain